MMWMRGGPGAISKCVYGDVGQRGGLASAARKNGVVLDAASRVAMFNKLPVWARADQAGQLPFSAFDQNGTGQRYVVNTLCRCIADWAGPQTRRKKASGSCFASGDVYTTNGAGSARRGKREIVATGPSSKHRHRAAIQETMSTRLQCRRVCPGKECVYLGSKLAQWNCRIEAGFGERGEDGGKEKRW